MSIIAFIDSMKAMSIIAFIDSMLLAPSSTLYNEWLCISIKLYKKFTPYKKSYIGIVAQAKRFVKTIILINYKLFMSKILCMVDKMNEFC